MNAHDASVCAGLARAHDATNNHQGLSDVQRRAGHAALDTAARELSRHLDPGAQRAFVVKARGVSAGRAAAQRTGTYATAEDAAAAGCRRVKPPACSDCPERSGAGTRCCRDPGYI